MSDVVALRAAIDLLLVPSQARFLRAEPLPQGVATLLRIAAGDQETESTAAALIDRPRGLVHQAATFFIEQILFAPHADSYRVLGTGPKASAAELRRNVGLLLRWLHPDLDPKGERSVFVSRVTAAWNDLKTVERRAAYDEALRRQGDKSKSRPKMNKAGSGSRRNVKGFAGANDRSGDSIHRRHWKGSWWRALSALFHLQRY